MCVVCPERLVPAMSGRHATFTTRHLGGASTSSTGVVMEMETVSPPRVNVSTTVPQRRRRRFQLMLPQVSLTEGYQLA